MRQLVNLATLIIFAGLCFQMPAQAQSGPGVGIVLDEGTELEKEGREQLLRLLSEYDLKPWIFTRKVKIEAVLEKNGMITHPNRK